MIAMKGLLGRRTRVTVHIKPLQIRKSRHNEQPRYSLSASYPKSINGFPLRVPMQNRVQYLQQYFEADLLRLRCKILEQTVSTVVQLSYYNIVTAEHVQELRESCADVFLSTARISAAEVFPNISRFARAATCEIFVFKWFLEVPGFELPWLQKWQI
jgi:hypothetical protein